MRAEGASTGPYTKYPMAPFAEIVALLLSWPACLLWLAILFRDDISRALGRLREFKVSRQSAEGRLDPTKPRRSRRRSR